MLLLRCLLLLCVAGVAQAEPHTVILVRHAEKSAEAGSDPALSEAGKARAQQLAEALADAGVGRILITQFRRTRDTAAPLAARLGIEAQVVAASADTAAHVAAVAAAVRASEGAVLVVGHSNTVPAIVTALGGPRLAPLCDGQYSRVFVLHRLGEGARLQRWHYGVPDQPSSAACG